MRTNSDCFTTQHWLVFITGMECVYCGIRTEHLNITQVKFSSHLTEKINPVKPSGYYSYMDHQVWYSTILRSAHTVYLCVSENKRRLFPYITWTDWFVQPSWGVFTARYELRLYNSCNLGRMYRTIITRMYMYLRTYVYVWWYCITCRITRFLDSVHHLMFQEQRSISRTEYVSILRWKGLLEHHEEMFNIQTATRCNRDVCQYGD